MHERESPEVLARFEAGLDLVDAMAGKIARVVRTFIEYDDLVSAGREGLLVAARRFHPDRGVAFRGYAQWRVQGAIFDAVRRMGLVPRRTYAQLMALERAAQAGEARAEEVFADGPLQSEADEAAEEDLDEHSGNVVTAAALGMLTARLAREMDASRDPTSGDPEQALARAEMVEVVRRAVDTLDVRQAVVIRRHYFEDQSLEQIAVELDASSSWTSRLHTRAMASLTKRLRGAA